MNRLLGTLLAGAVVGVGVAPALAADLPAPEAPEVYSAPVPEERFYWTGFYFGGNLGYGWANNDATGTPTGAFELSPNGVNTGIHAGYNYMFSPSFLLGVEADIAYTDFEQTATRGGVAVRTSSDWLSTIRGRAGWAYENLLVYGTAGLAIADREWSAAGVTDSNVDFGWTVGGGVEAGLTPNITARAEYLYANFGEENYNLGGGTSVRSDLDEHIARVGLSYKF